MIALQLIKASGKLTSQFILRLIQQLNIFILVVRFLYYSRIMRPIKTFLLCVLILFGNSFAQGDSTVTKDEKEFRSLPNDAYRAGEKLSFLCHYGWIDAGRATIEVKPDVVDINGRKCLAVELKVEQLECWIGLIM